MLQVLMLNVQNWLRFFEEKLFMYIFKTTNHIFTRASNKNDALDKVSLIRVEFSLNTSMLHM